MKTTEGFSVADSRNLPKVDYFMMLEYMQESDNYNAAEIRGAKTLLSSRDAYTKSAIGYVEIKREFQKCIVKCRVTPEHKINSKMYSVVATICESTEKIVDIKCQDCAAAEGGCKHAICFLMWLIKKTEEPSVTSVTCYWKKPKLSEAVTREKFILSRNINPKRSILTEEENAGPSRESFINECKKRQIGGALLMNYSGEKQPKLSDFAIFNPMVEFCAECVIHDYENFKAFSESKLNEEKVLLIAQKTSGQTSDKLWHHMRQNRVTASKIYEATKCSTDNGALVQTILGGYKVPETAAIKRGKRLENEVVKKLEEELNTKITPSGFILINPIMGHHQMEYVNI